MFHRIKSITTYPDFSMDVAFVNGEKRRYDMTPLFKNHAVFCTLRDNPGLFGEAMVDVGGHGVVWNDEIDISSEELFNNGIALPLAVGV